MMSFFIALLASFFFLHICGGKSYEMSCRRIPIKLADIKQAAGMK